MSVCPACRPLVERAHDEALKAKEEREAIIQRLVAAERTIGGLKAERSREDRDDPCSEQVAAWLDYWQTELSTRRSDIKPGGDRWARARVAMERKIAKGQELTPEERDGLPPAEWALSELKLAVDGLKLSSYHMGVNAQRKRYADVKHVLKDQAVTDGFIDDARRQFSPATFAALPDVGRAPAVGPGMRVVGDWVLRQYDEALTSAVREVEVLRGALDVSRVVVGELSGWLEGVMVENDSLRVRVDADRVQLGLRAA